jgi:hypothetical protein
MFYEIPLMKFPESDETTDKRLDLLSCIAFDYNYHHIKLKVEVGGRALGKKNTPGC